jgi:hypothetical protein
MPTADISDFAPAHAPATPTSVSARRGNDPRLLPTYDLYRRLRQVVVGLDPKASPEALIAQLLALFDETAAPESAVIRAAHAYRRRPRSYVRVARRGPSDGDGMPAWLGEGLAIDHPLTRELLTGGVATTASDDGKATIAAIGFGAKREFILVFVLARCLPEEETAAFLVALRSLADIAVRHRDLTAAMAQAREVQTSLLLAAPPEFPGYEIAFGARPAALVGGDVYDFVRVPGGTLGVAVGDAAGHGLGAALQARDVIVGLRMGVEESLKIFRTMEKLASVVRRNSPASSRFISLFYAELHRNGHLIYVNAGHPPPLVLRAAGGVSTLEASGPVMGLDIVPAVYAPSFDALGRGDLAVLYTDGILEAVDRHDREFGRDRLVGALRERNNESAPDLVTRVFATLDSFTEGAPQSDDQTLVLVRRRAEAARD